MSHESDRPVENSAQALGLAPDVDALAVANRPTAIEHYIEGAERRGEKPFPDALVMPVVYAAGHWPQVNAPMIVAMGKAAAEEVDKGQTWDNIFGYERLTAEQLVIMGKGATRSHARVLEDDKLEFKAGATHTQNHREHNLSPGKLASMVTGSQLATRRASVVFLRAAGAQDAKERGLRGTTMGRDTLKGGQPYIPAVQALGELWRVAGTALTGDAPNKASMHYRELVKEIWGRADIDSRAKRELTSDIEDMTGALLRPLLDAHVLSEVERIGAETGFILPREAVVAWLDDIFKPSLPQ